MGGLADKTEVLVVGAGPTGLTVASLLAQAGIDVTVVERNPTTSDLPRAVTLDDEGARTMNSIGLIDEIDKVTLPSKGARYYLETGACFAVVGSGIGDYGFHKRIIFHQPDLEDILRRGTDRFANLKLHFSTELEDFSQNSSGVDCALRINTGESHTIHSDYLLACDGGRSPVRSALGIAMHGETYGQDWIVLDLNEDEDQEPVSKFHCDPARPWVSIPAPHSGRRYEFMLLEGEAPEEMLRDEILTDLLAPIRPLRPDQIIRKTVYTFHARLAERLQEGRILLLGDAAHMTPPFAGQGMNAGLRDTQNVAWKLAAVLKGHADPSILASYDDERRDPTWAMIQLAVAMGEVVMPLGQSQVTLRNALVQGLEKFPEARPYFLGMKFKPKPQYDRGLFVGLDDPERLPAALVGHMMPLPKVEDADGRIWLLDDLIGHRFALLCQDDAGAEAVAANDHPLWDRLDVKKLWLRDGELNSPALVDQCHPVEADLFRPFRTHRDQVMLIRPDRYVAGVCAPNDLNGLADRFSELLQDYAARSPDC